MRWKNEEGLITVTHKIRLIRINLKSAELLNTGRKILKETEGHLKNNGLKGFWSLNSNKCSLLDYYLKISKTRINLGIQRVLASNQPMGKPLPLANATTFASGRREEARG